jgi:molybdate transport system substrate-binding protein
VSEILAVPGAVLAGQIPAEVQNYTTFSAALGAKAQNVAGAQALLARLGDAETAALARAKGMETG